MIKYFCDSCGAEITNGDGVKYFRYGFTNDKAFSFTPKSLLLCANCSQKLQTILDSRIE